MLETTAVILFAIAAVGGLVMAVRRFQGRMAPWPLSILHAVLGAAGLVLVLVAVLGGAAGYALAALIILAVAALGGFFLASFHVRHTLAPKAVVVIHALVAVAGFLILLGGVLGLVGGA
jgi:hypothetical protein